MVDETKVDELASRKLQGRLGVRKELKALPALLAPDEDLLTMASGAYEGRTGLLVLTDQRVVFVEKGLARERVEEFPYGRITSVQSEHGMMMGKVTLWASGNTAILQNIAPKERAKEVADVIRARMTAPAPASAPAPAGASAPAEDPLDRLRKLADLRTAGVLTDDEFQEQKARILGKA